MLYYTWANEPEVRANSINKEDILLAGHTNWFLKRLKDEHIVFLILEEKGLAVGQLRIDMNENEAIINFSIDKNQRGKGYGTSILNAAYEHYKKLQINLPFIGFVKTNNIGSEKAFLKAGFAKEIELTCINEENYFKFTKL